MINTRNATIDVMRFLANFMVILIHVNFLNLSADTYGVPAFRFMADLICSFRISVPLFFIISGYFFGRKIVRGTDPLPLLKKALGRIFLLFVCWNVVYFIIPANWIQLTMEFGIMRPVYWHMLDGIREIVQDPWLLLMSGTRVHLWFLSALMMGFTVLVCFVSLKIEKYLIPFGFFLYAISVICTSHTWVLNGWDVSMISKMGPFTSTLFVALGWWLARRDYISLREGGVFFLIGILITSLEIYFLGRYHTASVLGNYLFGFIPLTIGLLVCAMHFSSIGKDTVFPYLGVNYTLGVYALHVLIMDNLGFLFRHVEPIVWDIFFPIAIYVIALFFIMLLKKFSLTRVLVG